MSTGMDMKVISADGTVITYETVGSGPSLVWSTARPALPLIKLLSGQVE
jgi:hypothetical protein